MLPTNTKRLKGDKITYLVMVLCLQVAGGAAPDIFVNKKDEADRITLQRKKMERTGVIDDFC
jgi:hypothetical protein